MSKMPEGKQIKLEYSPSEKQLEAHMCNEKIILFIENAVKEKLENS